MKDEKGGIRKLKKKDVRGWLIYKKSK